MKPGNNSSIRLNEKLPDCNAKIVVYCMIKMNYTELSQDMDFWEILLLSHTTKTFRFSPAIAFPTMKCAFHVNALMIPWKEYLYWTKVNFRHLICILCLNIFVDKGRKHFQRMWALSYFKVQINATKPELYYQCRCTTHVQKMVSSCYKQQIISVFSTLYEKKLLW